MTPRILDNHVVVPTADPAQLRQLFPSMKEGKVGNQTFVALPHTIEVARILNNVGIKVQSPIRTQYDWPGRYTPRYYQVDTAEFFTLNPRGYCLNAMRCVDKDTEYLTPTGWKKITEYTEGEVIAQWNPDTDQAEFVVPEEYVVTPCTEMIHIKTSTGVDQMLTPQHRMPYINDKGRLSEITAGQVHTRNVTTTYGFRGIIPVTFHAPDRKGLPLTDEEIRVMVMTIADGWFQSSTTRCHVRVKKQCKKERARRILADAGIEFKEHQRDYPTAKGFSIFRFYAPRREKVFTSWWWDASEAQLKVILDEVKYWDSSPRRSTAFAFSSAILASAEFIQYAAVSTKRVASLNANIRHRRGKTETEYVVYVRGNGNPLGIGNRTTTKQENSVVVPSPDGKCYCFTVPSTYFIARRNGCVFITGNTGKTLSSLWAADYLKQVEIINRTLIVAPLSTLWDVWLQNIFESFPLRSYAVLHGSREKRLKLLAEPHDFYIVNHHGIQIIEKALAKRPDIDLVIIDELACYRNSRATTLHKPINRVVNQQGIVRSVWGLTGSPTPNDPTDAFGQCKLITPENYKGHFTSFKHETMMQISQFKWVEKKTAPESVARILKPSIRFERTVCTDMEPCYIDRRAELSADQARAYKDLINKAMAEIGASTITAVNAAVLVQKIIQIAAGVVYDVNGNFVKIDFGPRLSVLEELIEQNQEKVLVFVPFTGALNAVADALRKRWSVAIVDGSVTAGKRTKIFQEFRSLKDPHILCCHPGVMAHGLDLTAASLSIWYAAYWRAEIYQQANARTDGSKQKAKIDIAHIYATAEEKRVYLVLKSKGRLQDVVLGLVKGNN